MEIMISNNMLPTKQDIKFNISIKHILVLHIRIPHNTSFVNQLLNISFILLSVTSIILSPNYTFLIEEQDVNLHSNMQQELKIKHESVSLSRSNQGRMVDFISMMQACEIPLFNSLK